MLIVNYFLFWIILYINGATPQTSMMTAATRLFRIRFHHLAEVLFHNKKSPKVVKISPHWPQTNKSISFRKCFGHIEHPQWSLSESKNTKKHSTVFRLISSGPSCPGFDVAVLIDSTLLIPWTVLSLMMKPHYRINYEARCFETLSLAQKQILNNKKVRETWQIVKELFIQTK